MVLSSEPTYARNVAPGHPVAGACRTFGTRTEGSCSVLIGGKSNIVSVLVWDGVVFPRKAPISLSFQCKLEFQPSAWGWGVIIQESLDI